MYVQCTVPHIAKGQHIFLHWNFCTHFCKCEISGSSSDNQPNYGSGSRLHPLTGVNPLLIDFVLTIIDIENITNSQLYRLEL